MTSVLTSTILWEKSLWMVPRLPPMTPMRFFMVMVAPDVPCCLGRARLMRVSASRAWVTNAHLVSTVPWGMS